MCIYGGCTRMTQKASLTSKPTTRQSEKPINKRTHAILCAPPPMSHGGMEKGRHTDYGEDEPA
ncbi:hypothetical protein Hypma_001152 [Hypsizygus marmoreus]|uniref:Uncharacterized protein n=1 Tax=Hypsizygus marmoreus TaxID=39966 RepID=A0A369JFV2_HYPMA|nr:hypothetical protein Hypma_001152 [Hypsizygus marmoreus]